MAFGMRPRKRPRAEIHRVHQNLEATMVYVTHDQVEAMTLGDRIAGLKGGVMQRAANRHTLDHRQENPFVAGLIGSPPVNFLAAAVGSDGAVTLPGAPAFRRDPGTAGLAARRGGNRPSACPPKT